MEKGIGLIAEDLVFTGQHHPLIIAGIREKSPDKRLGFIQVIFLDSNGDTTAAPTSQGAGLWGFAPVDPLRPCRRYKTEKGEVAISSQNCISRLGVGLKELNETLIDIRIGGSQFSQVEF